MISFRVRLQFSGLHFGTWTRFEREMPTIGGRQVSWSFIAFCCLVLGAAWEAWTTVPRPRHVLTRLAPASGCPRPLPVRLAAPPELSLEDQCVLLWTAFRYPAKIGIAADTAMIDRAWISRERRDASLRTPLYHPVWEVTLWLRPAAGPQQTWRVTINRHHGGMWLEQGSLRTPNGTLVQFSLLARRRDPSGAPARPPAALVHRPSRGRIG